MPNLGSSAPTSTTFKISTTISSIHNYQSTRCKDSQTICLENELINHRTELTGRPTVADIFAHPAYPDTVWNLTPTKSGQLSVAAGRGGPIKLDWELHGTGDIKMIVCLFAHLPYLRAGFQGSSGDCHVREWADVGIFRSGSWAWVRLRYVYEKIDCCT